MPVRFFYEDTSITIENPSQTESWLLKVINNGKCKLGELNYILCSDSYLEKMNKDYLMHDDYTDVLTFDHSETASHIAGDIFISIERVQENAETYDSSFDEELHRVLVHGVLHLFGFDDKTEAEKEEMRKKEDACLSLRKD